MTIFTRQVKSCEYCILVKDDIVAKSESTVKVENNIRCKVRLRYGHLNHASRKRQTHKK